MLKLVESWKKLAAILADRKVAPEERAAFLEALAEMIAGVFECVAPFLVLKGPAASVVNRTVSNLKLTAGDLKKSA